MHNNEINNITLCTKKSLNVCDYCLAKLQNFIFNIQVDPVKQKGKCDLCGKEEFLRDPMDLGKAYW